VALPVQEAFLSQDVSPRMVDESGKRKDMSDKKDKVDKKDKNEGNLDKKITMQKKRNNNNKTLFEFSDAASKLDKGSKN